jgi:hypothetical protein
MVMECVNITCQAKNKLEKFFLEFSRDKKTQIKKML